MSISGDSVNPQDGLGEQELEQASAIAPQALANVALGIVTGGIYQVGEKLLSTKVPVALWYNYRNDSEHFGLHQHWDGTKYSAKLPVWQKFKDLARGTGSNDPESYWG